NIPMSPIIIRGPYNKSHSYLTANQTNDVYSLFEKFQVIRIIISLNSCALVPTMTRSLRLMRLIFSLKALNRPPHRPNLCIFLIRNLKNFLDLSNSRLQQRLTSSSNYRTPSKSSPLSSTKPKRKSSTLQQKSTLCNNM
ncbi:hypothetical protein CU098_003756, partial [Rhizopus stolonifer]